MAETKTTICKYIDQPMKIDGLLDDPGWEKSEVLPFFIPVTHANPISKTEARILWDENYLYVGFKAWDRDIYSYFTERDSTTCEEDVLEVFFKTHADRDPYINFEINALGTVYDAFNLKIGAGGGDHHRWNRWNCEGLKVGVHIEGTINDPSDEDEYWQLEIAIPFAEIPTLSGPPQPGDVWSFHLSRYDYSVYLPGGVELTSTAPLSAVNFHLVEEFTPLRFEK